MFDDDVVIKNSKILYENWTLVKIKQSVVKDIGKIMTFEKPVEIKNFFEKYEKIKHISIGDKHHFCWISLLLWFSEL